VLQLAGPLSLPLPGVIGRVAERPVPDDVSNRTRGPGRRGTGPAARPARSTGARYGRALRVPVRPTARLSRATGEHTVRRRRTEGGQPRSTRHGCSEWLSAQTLRPAVIAGAHGFAPAREGYLCLVRTTLTRQQTAPVRTVKNGRTVAAFDPAGRRRGGAANRRSRARGNRDARLRRHLRPAHDTKDRVYGTRTPRIRSRARTGREVGRDRRVRGTSQTRLRDPQLAARLVRASR